MKLLRHGVAAIIVFASVITLYLAMYNGMVDGYGFTPGGDQTITYADGTIRTGNIAEQFSEMNLAQGVESINNAILTLQNPISVDLLGALALGAIGIIRSVIGLITVPFEFLFILGNFYGGTVGFLTQLVGLVIVYVGFILLSAYLRSDV